jgi:hypothetical protein
MGGACEVFHPILRPRFTLVYRRIPIATTASQGCGSLQEPVKASRFPSRRMPSGTVKAALLALLPAPQALVPGRYDRPDAAGGFSEMSQKWHPRHPLGA